MASGTHSGKAHLPWMILAGASAAIFAGGWFIFLPRDPAMLALSNIAGFLLIAFIFFASVRQMRRAEGMAHTFWMLIAGGGLCWVVVQSCWVYIEVIQRALIPDLFWGDILLFLHLVPFMAAIALRPHAPRGALTGHRALDIAILSFWWFFLYIFALAPYQFVVRDPALYGPVFNALYMLEHAGLVIGFWTMQKRATGEWKRTYQRFAAAALIYGLTSAAINVAIDLPRNSNFRYYSGSLYDIGWIVALWCWAWAIFTSDAITEEPEVERRQEMRVTTESFWSGRLAMAAALTMPLLALYVVLFPSSVRAVDQFRLFVTCAALIPLSGIVFLKQRVMNQALQQSLMESRQALENLQQLQGNLVQTEKLASIGRLVAGAAHEINNPLTAILGYSELLATESREDTPQREYGEKIHQQAKRTVGLLGNLLAFAKHTPLQRQAVDLNQVTQRALQLQGLENGGSIRIVRELHADLPPIHGDENQILQVLMHVLNNAADAVRDNGGAGTVKVRTEIVAGFVTWICTDTGKGVVDAQRIFDPFFSTKPVGKGTGLGLSASYGIVRDHGGSITCHNEESGEESGGATFVVKLPVSKVSAAFGR